METQKRGKQSFILQQPPTITEWASVAGKKESEGPISNTFDVTQEQTYFGEKTWEQAEKRMQQIALTTLLKKSGIAIEDIGLVFSGDLLNQCVGSSLSLSNMGIAHLGLYGACSTMAESLVMAAMAVCGSFADNVIALTSSHFAASERQYRFPLGYGGQRTPTAQWTVTGSGAALVRSKGNGPKIRACTIGSVVDLGICDANNMGAAMAPAAVDTISAHFKDRKISADYYDMVVSGDLGKFGHTIVKEQLCQAGLDFEGRYIDCGMEIFDLESQDVHAGGSGCGCCASVFASYIYSLLKTQKLNRVLLVATGALMSTTSTFQGESIPGIAHAVAIERV